MNENTANRLSVAVAILLLFLTSIGDAKLMMVGSAAVLAFGLLFFSGKMKAKIVISTMIAFGVAITITRLVLK